MAKIDVSLEVKYPYALIVLTSDGKPTILKGEKCHDVKSVAGRLFQSSSVDGVLVGDVLGNIYLVLVKGHPEYTYNVPSETAPLG